GEQGLVEGETALTPIQRWFFERQLPQAHHFNQAVLLEAKEGVEAERLEEALKALVAHHDALRLRYEKGTAGWTQHHAGVGPGPYLRRLDVSASSDEGEALAKAAKELQGSLRLDEGLLLRALLVERSEGKPSWLLLAVHHLAVDGVSWRVLLEDLGTAYAQRRQGQNVTLPAKTTSFQTWARKLEEYARGPELEKEAAWWLAQAREETPALPMDAGGVRTVSSAQDAMAALTADAAGGASSTDASAQAALVSNTLASARSVVVALDAEETRTLLQEVPGAYRASVNEVLVSALARVLTKWTGQPRVRVEVEGHGREELFADVDVTRTVGWFTSLYPVVLEVAKEGTAGDALRAVRDTLRAVPGKGVGYGLLRYQGPEAIAAKLRQAPKAQVAFNYLGQFDALASGTGGFTLAKESAGPTQGEGGQRSHVLEVNGLVVGGQLEVTWTYSEALHTKATVEALAREYSEALKALVAGRKTEDAAKYTPADFPLAKLDAKTLAKVQAAVGQQVEDVYPLSPMQQGMLFHALLSPKSGVYFEQLSWAFHAKLDVAALKRAWEELVARHAVLRTTLLWEGLEAPLQVVRREAALPWRELDWRGQTEAAQRQALDAYLEEDRAQGFSLTQGPLLRVALVRLDSHVHRLIWSFHHTLLDGWSLGLVMQDVFGFYDAFSRSQAPLVVARPPFRDYIAWLGQQESARSEAFWRERLAGFTAPTPLPLDQGTGADDSESVHRHGSQEIALSAETTAAIESFARRHQLTLGAVVQGAWALLLSRYSGEQDVVFGTTVSGRPSELPGVEGMMGLFINSLPLRVRITPADTLVSWLQGIQTQQVSLSAHEHCPLVQVQSWSELPRGQALFESLVVVENYPIDASIKERARGLDVRDFEGRERLTLPLAPAVLPGEKLGLRLSYQLSRFDAEAMTRLLGHWRTLLEGIAVAAADSRVSRLSLLTDSERHQVLKDWNATQAPLEAEASLHGLFEAQVERTPDGIAVELDDTRWTYRELNARANQLARQLKLLGVGPEVRVGVCLERSPELLMALLGILKAGGAYVPVDPDYPQHRIAYLLEDSRVPVLVTREAIADELPSRGEQLLCVDSDAASLARQPSGNLPALGGRHLAYVIYTSGSTGQPKGALVEHRGIVNTLAQAVRDFDVRPGTRTLQFVSMSFDVSLLEIFSTLVGGGTLVLAPREALRPGPELARLMRERDITTSVLLPSTLAVLASDDFPTLQTVVTGAEACPAEVMDRWAQGRRFVNSYGPTEASITVTSALCAPGSGTPPIGRPYPNVRAYVLDATGAPVPVGIAGELFIGGAGVGRGYLGRPEQTAERFVPDPFGSEPGARLYRTGDLVRYRADGALEFVGRTDHQVKVRGFRIELGEIEAVLAGAVSEAVVLARQDVPGDRRLVAYVVAREDETVDATALRRYLEDKLPEHMVPSAFVVLDAMPLTPNGKVDRKALPAPDAVRSEQGPTYVAPRTPVEETLAATWRELLGVSQVGIHDDFLELGGHSLLATQAISRIRAAFGVELPLRALFEAPTVAALAQRVEAARAEASPGVPPLKPAARTGPLPLSFAQQRLWFLEQLSPQGSLYNIPSLLKLEGHLDVAALEQALNALVLRHESLRTTFHAEEGRPFQRIIEAPVLPLPVVDLREVDAALREQEAWRLARAEAQRPFDLVHGPLLRVTLLRTEEREHLLVLSMHHIVSDGWSAGVLVREWVALYAARIEQRDAVLPPLPVQYADYAVWQREWLKGDALEEQVGWWRRELDGAPAALELPTDRVRPAKLTERGGSVPVRLSKPLSDALRTLGRGEGATPFMVLLAAWQVLLSRYSGQDDISVGTPVAGRSQAEVEGLIGLFLNTLVLRTRVRAADRFREVLARVKETTLGAFAHQQVPFERLVDALRPERDLGRTPLFQAMLVLNTEVDTSLSLSDLTLRRLELENLAAKFELNLSLSDAPEGFQGALTYSADLFERPTVERMVQHLGVLLEGIAATPDASVSALPMLAEAEREQVLTTWNQTAEAVPLESIHARFEAQVERVPGGVAVVAGGKQLTYAELDAKANRLARALVKQGVGPDVLVGLYVERTVEAVVGMLGILKAGGGYVPMDTSFPEARVKAIAEDAGLRVVVTQRAQAADVAGLGLVTVIVEAVEEAGGSTEPVRSNVRGENAAYAIFTSGSTGRPKGVVVEHRQLANYVGSIRGRLRLEEGMSFASVTTLAADLGHTAVFPMLCGGGTLHLVSKEVASDAEALGAYMQAHGVDGLKVVPSHLRALLSGPNAKAVLPRKRLVVGGEASDKELVETVKRLAPECAVFNHYGPTETTVGVLTNPVEGAWEEGAATLALGRPIGNARMYVLDASGHPVPRGVAGELYVGGAVVTRGYVGRPELTAERYVPDSFSTEPGARLYRTGDKVRQREDGKLEFLGRVDFQLKIRGYRVELGEVEAGLGACEGVREAVVIAREDAPGDKRLVAYVVAKPGSTVEATALRSELKGQLPEYMVPSAFVVLEAMPLNANGKVDRKALPAPDAESEPRSRDFVAPRSDLEQQLAAIYSELLGVKRVGIHDGFFELGGHSLLATQAISRIRQTFQVELPLRKLFESPTVETLAVLVMEAQAAQVDPEELERLMAEMEELSGEEAQALLDAETEQVRKTSNE
ncbi:amino acid adenylation domain-containing protein, partial [Corallococcus exercitus]|nr:amino acid adenylation domain-containing protein [Corallococcus exercitus]